MDARDRPLVGVARAIPHGVIRCERSLPFKGEVLAGVGQRVEPNQVLAQTILPAEVRVLHLARALSAPEGDLSRYLLKRPGEAVEKGEILATKKGLLIRSYRSPYAGKILAEGGGRLLFAVSPSPLELQANLKGEVVGILPGRGAVVEARGAIVEGVWGNGVEGFGVMKLVNEGQGALVAEALDMSYHGAILVCGAGATEEGLNKARELESRGVILGSLRSSLKELALSLPFPVVTMEGFGEATMNMPFLSLFRAGVGREISIINRQSDEVGRAPQVILPYYGDEALEKLEALPLEEGTQVRMTREPYLGRLGLVVEPAQKVRKMESGLEAAGVEVDLEGGERVFVPLTNLEILRRLAGE